MSKGPCKKCGQAAWLNREGICGECRRKAWLLILTQKALDLKELDKQVVKASVEQADHDSWIETIFNFSEKLKELKAGLVDVDIAEIHNKEAREIIQKIFKEKKNETLPSVKLLRLLKAEGYEIGELDDFELDQLASDLFYSWYSGFDYIRLLFELGPLTIGLSLPKDHYLNIFFRESRGCYAFHNYHALYALCRTVLEITARDIYMRIRGEKNEGEALDIDLYALGRLIPLVSGNNDSIKKRMDEIRKKTNPLIHGRKRIKAKEAKETFRETISLIQDLYKLHRLEA